MTVYENSSHSPTGRPFVVAPYQRPTAETSSPERDRVAIREQFDLPGVAEGATPGLRLYTTMATWCASCRAELPELTRLRSEFSQEDLAMYGVPIDEEDSPQMLSEYTEQLSPPYELLASLPGQLRKLVQDRVNGAVSIQDALPASILTDADGAVLSIQLGAPSVSELRRRLAELRGPAGELESSR